MAPQTIKIDSVSFHVLHEGDPSAPLVVLVHALMANLHMWDSTVSALHAAGYSTLRYDHLGHGQTSVPSDDEVDNYFFDDFVGHIHSLVERVTSPGTKPHAIIGCSMGGVIAVRYALMYPGQVSHVMSLDAPAMTTRPDVVPKWKERIEQFEAQGVEALAKATVERWVPEPYPEGARDAILKLCLTTTLNGYKACAHGICNYDYTDQLHKISDKTGEKVMILIGTKDVSIGPREVHVKTAEKIHGAEFVEMKDTGHLPPMHWPEEFEGIMLKFLKGSGGSAGGEEPGMRHEKDTTRGAPNATTGAAEVSSVIPDS